MLNGIGADCRQLHAHVSSGWCFCCCFRRLTLAFRLSNTVQSSVLDIDTIDNRYFLLDLVFSKIRHVALVCFACRVTNNTASIVCIEFKKVQPYLKLLPTGHYSFDCDLNINSMWISSQYDKSNSAILKAPGLVLNLKNDTHCYLE